MTIISICHRKKQRLRESERLVQGPKVTQQTWDLKAGGSALLITMLRGLKTQWPSEPPFTTQRLLFIPPGSSRFDFIGPVL